MKFREWLAEKLNPAQRIINDEYGHSNSTTAKYTSVSRAYREVIPVQRGVNFIVDCASEITFDVGDRINALSIVSEDIRTSKLNKLLNHQPNIFQDRIHFLRDIYLDLLLEGNIFLYWDGAFLYHIPARNVIVHSSATTFIDHYSYGEIDFGPNEMIWIKDNSINLYRGYTRLNSALEQVNLMKYMTNYFHNFFKNNTIPGMILTSPNTLSTKYKEKMIAEWTRDYNVEKGGRKPLILDSDFDIKSLGTTDLRELDFSESMALMENNIYKALGIPPILLNSGNNANITPNLKVFYLSTVVPLVTKLMSGLERFFGYDLGIVKQDIMALKPELKDEANYYATLVNSGIITRNEAREKLRYEEMDQEMASELILPANIAGSALDAGEGGRPSNAQDNE